MSESNGPKKETVRITLPPRPPARGLGVGVRESRGTNAPAAPGDPSGPPRKIPPPPPPARRLPPPPPPAKNRTADSLPRSIPLPPAAPLPAFSPTPAPPASNDTPPRATPSVIPMPPRPRILPPPPRIIPPSEPLPASPEVLPKMAGATSRNGLAQGSGAHHHPAPAHRSSCACHRQNGPDAAAPHHAGAPSAPERHHPRRGKCAAVVTRGSIPDVRRGAAADLLDDLRDLDRHFAYPDLELL